MGETPAGRVTVVGLGTGAWNDLTVEAAELLRQCGQLYVRSEHHPVVLAVASRLQGCEIRALPDSGDLPLTAEQDAVRTMKELMVHARKRDEIVFGVPGSPVRDDVTVAMLLQQRHVAVRLIPGVSLAERALAVLGVPATRWLEVIDANEIALYAREDAVGQVEGADSSLPWRAPVPTAPLLVTFLGSSAVAGEVSRWLGRFYPSAHSVSLVGVGPNGEAGVTSVPLDDLGAQGGIDLATVLYVPPLGETDNIRTFAGLMQLTRTLRAPGGCPWDREQTHATLKPHLLEEAYEVLDALDGGDPAHLREEMGDLLFQITIHSQIAAEMGEFTIEDVIAGIMSKLIGRHPHVFGDMELGSAQDVRHAWESFKQREKPQRTSVLEQIPKGLPALPQSNLMQKRAASVGFEWPTASDVLDKVDEEIRELRHEIGASSKDLQREELGDILFALVSVARHLRIDPEEALRLANRKFAARFQYVEARVTAQGKALRDLSPEELDEYWNAAKALGHSAQAPAGSE